MFKNIIVKINSKIKSKINNSLIKIRKKPIINPIKMMMIRISMTIQKKMRTQILESIIMEMMVICNKVKDLVMVILSIIIMVEILIRELIQSLILRLIGCILIRFPIINRILSILSHSQIHKITKIPTLMYIQMEEHIKLPIYM
jgi:hypothetical protein